MGNSDRVEFGMKLMNIGLMVAMAPFLLVIVGGFSFGLYRMYRESVYAGVFFTVVLVGALMAALGFWITGKEVNKL